MDAAMVKTGRHFLSYLDHLVANSPKDYTKLIHNVMANAATDPKHAFHAQRTPQRAKRVNISFAFCVKSIHGPELRGE
ncbi:hypothetical protein SeLEV6574_g08105 [Synchytrium endobioticum]|uniref:Uncharacterized protein n=1 Tax=Synchytrium endobioticum TaxID=286115 RepID=A0A507C9C0_9FUNG|nr:hypothetical protein SeLEV6574_g08105 [Synchytrium endobioticum]